MFTCPVCHQVLPEKGDYAIHLLNNRKTAEYQKILIGLRDTVLFHADTKDMYCFEIADCFIQNEQFPECDVNILTEFISNLIVQAGYSHRKRVSKQREIAESGRRILSVDDLCNCLYLALPQKFRNNNCQYTPSNPLSFWANNGVDDILEVTRIFTFAAAHHLPYHQGLCRFTHGHEWKLEVTIADAVNSNEMVLDFSDLKQAVNKYIINRLDHNYLNDIIYNPTAENLCEWIWRKLYDNTYFPIQRIVLWESENSFAELNKNNRRTL